MDIKNIQDKPDEVMLLEWFIKDLTDKGIEYSHDSLRVDVVQNIVINQDTWEIDIVGTDTVRKVPADLLIPGPSEGTVFAYLNGNENIVMWKVPYLPHQVPCRSEVIRIMGIKQ